MKLSYKYREKNEMKDSIGQCLDNSEHVLDNNGYSLDISKHRRENLPLNLYIIF